MKILRIVNRFNLGGPIYNAAWLTAGMPPDCETRLVGGSPSPGEAHSGFILDDMGIAYVEIEEMKRSLNPLNDIRAFLKIRRMIREFRPDIVHTHAAKAGALGRIAARFYGVPVIIHTYHGHVFEGYFNPLISGVIRLTERLLARLTTAVIVISPAQKKDIVDKFRIAGRNKVHVIPLGFDLGKFRSGRQEKRSAFRNQYGVGDNELAVGIIGRLTAVKNHRLFLDAVALLFQKNINLRVFVIGDGELSDDLGRAADQVMSSFPRAAGQIIFTSWIRQMDIAIAGLDIVALTSVSEGTPVSLIEAQAGGKPVVTTDVGGVRDCVQDEITGLIVDKPDPSTFAAALERLLNDPVLMQRLGTNGEQFVAEKYDHKRLVSDVEKLYRNLLNHNKQS